MASICHGFVENAWRKDICSNCFRLKEEHSSRQNLHNFNSVAIHVKAPLSASNPNLSALQQQQRYQSPSSSQFAVYPGTGIPRLGSKYAGGQQPNQNHNNNQQQGTKGNCGNSLYSNNNHYEKGRAGRKEEFGVNGSSETTRVISIGSGGNKGVHQTVTTSQLRVPVGPKESGRNNPLLSTSYTHSLGPKTTVSVQVTATRNNNNRNRMETHDSGNHFPHQPDQNKFGTYKGILRDAKKSRKRLSVNFSRQICEVIRSDCDPDEEEEESDEETIDDPLDSKSIAEIMEISAKTLSDQELNRLTIKNTNFNSIKTNLLGTTSIEIGPIVGLMGGKSLETGSKPLVSIGTFDSRPEPLRILNGKNKSQPESLPAKKKEKVEFQSNLVSNAKEPESNSSVVTKSILKNVPSSHNPEGSDKIKISKNIPITSSMFKNNVKVGSVGQKSRVDEYPGSVISMIEVDPEVPKISQMEPQSSPHYKTQREEENNNKELSNLFILNDGNIARKRTSFLKEIIEKIEPDFKIKPNDEDSLEPPKVITSQLKIQQENSAFGRMNREEDLEFDDSLEDSGLDIGLPKDKASSSGSSSSSERNENENGESDIEKCSSDSGNENDFSDRGGLYISVDDEELNKIIKCNKEAQKLSPDSVLFSSEAECCDSIPEDLNLKSNSLDVSPTQKRHAPAPPINSDIYEETPMINKAKVSEKNDVQPIKLNPRNFDLDECDYDDARGMVKESDHEEESEDQHIYEHDFDVKSFRKNLTDEHIYQHDYVIKEAVIKCGVKPVFQLEDEEAEENIYDDCMNVKGTDTSKVTTGSYDFTSGTRTTLDAEGDKPIAERTDGIEFKGIRKIDSEAYFGRSPSPPAEPAEDKKNRASSVSPKARRKVNQFFSTIGKKAGAAFSSAQHSSQMAFSGGNRGLSKSPSPGPPSSSFTGYRRSMSQDEVSMTRTQEIYATITPTSMKFKGLAPVLHKLSKIDLNSGAGSEKEDKEGKDKLFKKNKFSNSIKKFLRFGQKDEAGKEGDNGRNALPLPSPLAMERKSSSASLTSIEETGSNMRPDPGPDVPNVHVNGVSVKVTVGNGRPPPPPPRVHAVDHFNRGGTQKPARPPPPVRASNRVAPSFVSVFDGHDDHEGERLTPPNKPKRKASMNSHSASGIRPNDPPSSSSQVNSLNSETLRLIASQTPAKIQRSLDNQMLSNSMRFSDFFVTDTFPVLYGPGYAIYVAFWREEELLLLIQDYDSNNFLESVVEIVASFDDYVPSLFAPSGSNDRKGHDVKVHVSILPRCIIQPMFEYLGNPCVTQHSKYFALLQAMNFYWAEEPDISRLLVLQGDYSEKDREIIYVVAPPKQKREKPRMADPSLFEISMKEILLTELLIGGEWDREREVLLRRVSGSCREVENQLRLFLQIQLFSPRENSQDFVKIQQFKTERSINGWIERERAICMKEAIERTLQRNSEPITPLKKAFVEFLMVAETSAKNILEVLVDLI